MLLVVGPHVAVDGARRLLEASDRLVPPFLRATAYAKRERDARNDNNHLSNHRSILSFSESNACICKMARRSGTGNPSFHWTHAQNVFVPWNGLSMQ